MLIRLQGQAGTAAARSRVLWHRGRRALRGEDRPIDRQAFYQQLWRETASSIGADVVELVGGFTELRRGSARLRVYGGLVPLDDPVTLELAGNKPAAAHLLAAAGIPVPDHVLVSPTSLSPARDLLAACGQVVVKPLARTGGGTGVVTHVRHESQLRRAVEHAAAFGAGVVVEEQLPGRAHRLLYLDGALLDAVVRDPATVRGDGETTVKDLVARENARRRALGGGATGLLPGGIELRTTLGAQGLDPGSVPPASAVVRVSGRSNTGGIEDSRSVTDEVGDDVRAVAAAAASTLGVRLAGVDVLTTDLGAPLSATGGVVNEVNTTPGLHWHYLIKPGTAHTPVAARIADHLLTEP